MYRCYFLFFSEVDLLSYVGNFASETRTCMNLVYSYSYLSVSDSAKVPILVSKAALKTS